jgi:hypothetical protein
MSGWNYNMRECRTPIQGTVDCETGDGQPALAQWQDVSRTGAQLRLDQYLAPGREVRLGFQSPLWFAGRVELKARVAWCFQIPGTAAFAAGLVIKREDPEAALAFSALRDRVPAANGLATEWVELPRWTALEAVGESEHCVSGRMALQHAV